MALGSLFFGELSRAATRAGLAHLTRETRRATVPSGVVFVTVKSVTIIYSTEGLIDRNKGKVGKQTEPKEFASVEDARAAPFPDGYTFARISVPDDSYRAYSPTLGWESHELARA
jgi:hypothetical protein